MRVYELSGTSGIASISRASRADPTTAPNQVLIRMRAGSLNYRDLLIINGACGDLKPKSTIALSDGAGEVVAVGSAVRRFATGDRVTPTFTGNWVNVPMTSADPPTARGGKADVVQAELIASDENFVVLMPDHLPFQDDSYGRPCAVYV